MELIAVSKKNLALKLSLLTPVLIVKKNQLQDDQQKEPHTVMLSWCSQHDSMHITCTGELILCFPAFVYQKGFLSYLGKSL